MISQVYLRPLEKFWLSRSRWFRGTVIGLIGFVLEFSSDAIAHMFDLSWTQIHLKEDFGSGVILFAIGFWIANLHDKALRKRSETMAYLHHHCRNALQVLAYANTVGDSEKRKQMIEDSVQRVLNALTEASKEDQKLEDQFNTGA